jgi:hypothetical protein
MISGTCKRETSSDHTRLMQSTINSCLPHAHPDRHAENMEELGVPNAYIKWMRAKFDGRTTCLAFDDYESAPLPISNDIKDVTPKICQNSAPARRNSAFLTGFRSRTGSRTRERGNSAKFGKLSACAGASRTGETFRINRIPARGLLHARWQKRWRGGSQDIDEHRNPPQMRYE